MFSSPETVYIDSHAISIKNAYHKPVLINNRLLQLVWECSKAKCIVSDVPHEMIKQMYSPAVRRKNIRRLTHGSHRVADQVVHHTSRLPHQERAGFIQASGGIKLALRKFK